MARAADAGRDASGRGVAGHNGAGEVRCGTVRRGAVRLGAVGYGTAGFGGSRCGMAGLPARVGNARAVFFGPGVPSRAGFFIPLGR
jgi:hypothetical protein